MADPEVTEPVARAHFPYRAEYCKTSRAKCKKCSEPMNAHSLKLAIMTKSRFHEGYDANFYHVECFFRIKRPDSVAEIGHFETLKYDDQKMLEQAIETKGRSILGEFVSSPPSKKSKKESKAAPPELVNYEDFLVEYAKSNRSTCNHCDQKIEKGAVRLGKLDFTAETPWGAGPVPRWFHVECFAKSLDQLEFFGQVEKIKDFSNLEQEDQKMLRKKIKVQASSGQPTDQQVKKVKTEEEKDREDKQAKEERHLRKQSDKFFALRGLVSTIKKKDLEEILSSMNQKYNYKATSVLVDMATDVLMFGPLSRCPKCKQEGGILLRGSSYICTMEKDGAPCTYESREPSRSAPFVPDEIADKYDFLNDGTYKFRGGQRLFPSKLIEAMKKREAEENNVVQEGAPLEGLTIGLTSWKALKNDKMKIQKQVTYLGGKLVTALDRTLFVILSSENELEKDTPKIEVVKDLKVPIARDDFLFNIKTKEDVVPQLSKSIINGWTGDLKERFVKMSSSTSTQDRNDSQPQEDKKQPIVKSES